MNTPTTDLKVTIIQTSLVWEKIDANLKWFDEKLLKIPKDSTDLIVLPEMFNTGFTMNADAFHELMNGKTMKWMLKKAKEKNAVVTGSLIIKEGENYFNRLIWMQPNDKIEYYDKRHLFRISDEHSNFTKGGNKLLVELKGWRICPMICYDLRFPVWVRNKDEYDLLLFVANWPERRNYPWQQLLIARAIENIAYVVGVNRIGEDGNGINHSGNSVVLDPLGMPLISTNPSLISNAEYIATVTLSHANLEKYRSTFPFAMDRDSFTIEG
ncbi:MAG: amidohydrolase [Bacteroidota bacterium]